MKNESSFASKALLVTLAFNAVLLVALYLMAGDALAGQVLVVFGLGLVVTLALWFTLTRLAPIHPTATAPAPAPEPPKKAAPPAGPSPRALAEASEASAVQVLALLQRKGRLIDFLQEDLSAYDDAQIGAAVRSIHEGCRQVLAEHVRLEPVYEQAEGSDVTISKGFDAHAVRLVGNVSGEPPFKGALVHRGWRVTRVDLPERTQGGDAVRILAPAEVEVR